MRPDTSNDQGNSDDSAQRDAMLRELDNLAALACLVALEECLIGNLNYGGRFSTKLKAAKPQSINTVACYLW